MGRGRSEDIIFLLNAWTFVRIFFSSCQHYIIVSILWYSDYCIVFFFPSYFIIPLIFLLKLQFWVCKMSDRLNYRQPPAQTQCREKHIIIYVC